MNRTIAKKVSLAALAALTTVSTTLSASLALANPPLSNPSFEILGPIGSPTVNTTAVGGGAGHSAAMGWGVFHNTAPSTTQTDLVASTLPIGGPRMLHVRTAGHNNGVTQVTGPFNSGPREAIASIWIYVVSGTVGIGTGNHGNTSIEATTTTTGAWEYLQVGNAQTPANSFIIYSQGGGAEFYVDLAELKEIQDFSTIQRIEYSNDFDEAAVLGGGDHGLPDPGQTLYTVALDGVLDDQPRDGVDFAPAIESGFEPDFQVDALANGADAGITQLLEDELDLLFSLRTDPGPSERIAAYAEMTNGALGVAYTHRALHALNIAGDIDDVDGLELWGDGQSADDAADADYFSLQGDDRDTSVWTYISGAPVSYISRTDILNQVNLLGFNGSIEEVDLDALMVRDTNGTGVWDQGDEILFSVRAGNSFDGGEIMHWRFGQNTEFLRHGGHLWDTAFEISKPLDLEESEEIDAIEVPEPATGMLLAMGTLLLTRLGVRRGGRASGA